MCQQDPGQPTRDTPEIQPAPVLNYDAPSPATHMPPPERPIHWVATLANVAIAIWALHTTVLLGPQFGDATSFHGIVLPLILCKLPLAITICVVLSPTTRRSRHAHSIALVATWTTAATWIAIWSTILIGRWFL